MGNWISKAANVFQRDVKETPQLFEVQCECGQSHRGVRRSRHQHIVCKDCGTSLFVLPRDVYPPPLEAKSKKKKKKTTVQPVVSTPVRGDDEDVTPDAQQADDLEEVVVLEKTAPRHRHRKQSETPPTSKKKNRKGPAEPSPPPQPGFFERFSTSCKAFALGIVKFWTPFRLAILGICLLIGFSVYWSVLEGARSRAAASVKRLAEQGMEAVENKDWIAARRAFEEATQAVDLLKRYDPEAEGLRRYYYETRALTDLSRVDLFQLLIAAEATQSSAGAEEWAKEFLAYQEDWLVITGPVEIKGDVYELYFPWGPGSPPRQVRVQVNFPDFAELISGAGKQNVTFGGELQSCTYSPETKTWTVMFNPETGFAWCHPETYDALNFERNPLETEDDMISRLARQKQRVGAER